MTYIAICLGMVFGQIIRFSFFLNRKERKKNKKKNLISELLPYIKVVVSKLCRNKVFRIIINIILYMVQALKRQKQIILSNKYIYIIAKVAQVYSYKDNKISIIRINDIKRYCLEHNEKYIKMEAVQKRPVCKPKFFEGTEEEIEWHYSPEVYIAELHNICITGASSVIKAEKQCLYDPLAYDKENRLDIKFSNVIGSVGENYIIENRKITNNIEEGIFLLGFASYNYYHMTIEIVSRLSYVDGFEKYRYLPIIVDEIMVQIPQYFQLLNQCNVYQHKIISLRHGEVARIGRLVYPSYNTWMPINVKDRNMIRTGDFVIAQSALENIRNYAQFNNVEKSRNIFISRKNVVSTRLKNEEKVRGLFEKHGFEVVFTEELSYKEQVNLFHMAKCVVGASGAALTNIIYCQEGTDIVCIIPEEYDFYMYSTIAYLLNLNPIFLNAKVVYKTPYTASDLFEVDLGYCERFLEQYICLGNV